MSQCPKCGLDLTDREEPGCPACNAKIVAAVGGGRSNRIWLGALFQFTLSTIFMLAFGFPRVAIAIFGLFILTGASLSAWLRPRQLAAARAPQRTVTHPTLFRIASLGVALSGFACFVILLFGFVGFINPYTRWQQYKGQPYHRADFEVTRVYFQKGSKGSIDVYASGTVDGQKEWMSLRPYLHDNPHDQGELEERVPAGTSIPIYLFPKMKGRLRVEVYSQVPTAEVYHRTAMTALNYALGALAIAASLFFALLRLRETCYEKKEAAFAATA